MEADRQEVNTDQPLRIEINNELCEVSPESYDFGEYGDLVVLWVEKHQKERIRPPFGKLHIPVESMTAASNRFEKSEQNAYRPSEIQRYSEIVNPSNEPNTACKELNVPYYEFWLTLDKLDEGNLF